MDPITHACTNSVESRWKYAKRKLSGFNGSSAELLSGYLDEYLWRERYGKNGTTAFENTLSHIAEIYSEGREKPAFSEGREKPAFSFGAAFKLGRMSDLRSGV